MADTTTDTTKGPGWAYKDDVVVEGVLIGFPFTKESVTAAANFTFDPEDILLASYPKVGNTWFSEIIWLIVNDVDVDSSNKLPLVKRMPLMEHGPMGDMEMGTSMIEKMKSPRTINTHLPYNVIAKNAEKARPKTIVVMRNPKDVTVSQYNFYNKLPGRDVPSFDYFFENIIKADKILFGKYSSHLKSYWGQKDAENFLFVSFEDMKEAPYECVERIARFLGKDLSTEQLQTVVDRTTFSKMKKLSAKLPNLRIGDRDADMAEDDAFYHKGIVGDWENMLSDEQNAYLEKEYDEILKPLGVQFKYTLPSNELSGL